MIPNLIAPSKLGHVSSQVDAFFSSLMMIIVSELGDKTFFIAAVGVVSDIWRNESEGKT